jgi:hypothetical protein
VLIHLPLSDHEDGGTTFLLNVGKFALDYTASQPRRYILHSHLRVNPKSPKINLSHLAFYFIFILDDYCLLGCDALYCDKSLPQTSEELIASIVRSEDYNYHNHRRENLKSHF